MFENPGGARCWLNRYIGSIGGGSSCGFYSAGNVGIVVEMDCGKCGSCGSNIVDGSDGGWGWWWR